MADRDRDATGRPRNARPRDGLGRPLEPGAAGVPRVPDDFVLPPVPALVEAQRLLDEGLPFHVPSSTSWAWKAAPPEERDLWQGLAQLAVGLTHLRRGNHAGATTLLRRGQRRIAGYAERPPYEIDIPGLIGWTDDALAALSQTPTGDADLGVAPPNLRRSTAGC